MGRGRQHGDSRCEDQKLGKPAESGVELVAQVGTGLQDAKLQYLILTRSRKVREEESSERKSPFQLFGGPAPKKHYGNKEP